LLKVLATWCAQLQQLAHVDLASAASLSSSEIIEVARLLSECEHQGRAAKGKSPRSSDVPQSSAPPPNQFDDWRTFSAMVDRVAELEKQVARLQATAGEGGSTS
jgi:hypothetical protein